MTYEQLKGIDRKEAIKMIFIDYIDETRVLNRFPSLSDVIVFGGHYWKNNELIVDFINEYVFPDNEKDIQLFLQEIAYRISSDPILTSNELRKNVDNDYSIIYDQYNKMIRRSPDTLIDWSEQKATFIWYEYILSSRREVQFKRIVKEQDTHKLNEISARIKQIYKFSDIEMIYLKYFCSQSKLNDLDTSLNTTLYLWSKEKKTGKSTVTSYICSFLNGESKRNENAHKSTLSREMQIQRFDIPCAVNSRCTMLDEAGFHDMTKTYDKFKSMITSNSCEIEYKYKSAHIPKKCYRNYIGTANIDPIYFVKDEEERRILSIHFTKPERISFEELEKIWYEFVLECNYSATKLEAIYEEFIMPNSQVGELKYIMSELENIITVEEIDRIANGGLFCVSNVMTIKEISVQNISRKTVKDVLINLYGEPDTKQRFNRNNRKNQIDFQQIKLELPF